MTITLQAGRTYRTRSGEVVGPIKVWEGFTEDATGLPLYIFGDDDNRYWRQYGLNGEPHTAPKPMHDLVEEVFPTATDPSSPVRQRTVTEIVPGAYGRLKVSTVTTPAGQVSVRLDPPGEIVIWHDLNAEELRALASTATQLADALDIIASERQS